MSKKLNKYISAIDYVDQTLLILSAASVFISITKYATALSLVFSLGNGVDKKFLKTKSKKEKEAHQSCIISKK